MIRLGTTELQWMASLERLTRIQAQDCVGDGQKIMFLLRPGEARQVLWDREAVQHLEKVLGRKVKLVESSRDLTKFLSNAFAPVEVRSVTLETRDGRRKAYVGVPKLYRGVAIGKGGHNIALIRQLAQRHLDIDDVVVGDKVKGEVRRPLPTPSAKGPATR